jgi:hypothetical protein
LLNGLVAGVGWQTLGAGARRRHFECKRGELAARNQMLNRLVLQTLVVGVVVLFPQQQHPLRGQ